jgi:outer membrane protein assembly factor BamB
MERPPCPVPNIRYPEPLIRVETTTDIFEVIHLRQFSWLATVLLLIGTANAANAQLSTGLITQQQAASVGLTRAWFARAAVDSGRSKVLDWILSNDELLIVTDAGVIQAIDANTGATCWTTQFGNPNFPSLGPAANDEFVGVINGSTLYLIERAGGRIVVTRPVGGVPGAGPALSKDYVFVPTIGGLIEGYPLAGDSPFGARWFYQSFGRTTVPPLVTPDRVVWTTDAGYLYVGGADDPGVRFRLETRAEFVARPAYRAPLIFAASLVGELFAVDEHEGTLAWKFVTGYPTYRAPAAVGDRLFVTSEEPTLHCVDANSGAHQWEVPGISQFATATKTHVFGVDRFDTIHILNIADGAAVGRISSGGMVTALVNDQTDRLFLISGKGLVQCLHEIGADKPTYYVVRPVAATKPAEPAAEEYQGDGQPAATKPAAAPPLPPQAAQPAPVENGGSLFGAPPKAAPPPEESSPFGTGEEDPFN